MITEGTDEEGLSPEASLQLIPAPPLSILNDTDKKIRVIFKLLLVAVLSLSSR